ncbi:TonB-dependent receptor [Dyadobacter sp. LJ53]|uniref:TonB-dependent receptor n=1 Tax=Dyadobacter chenwenxiniae TaxID=2906456 RepID=UPI001F3032FF|nr:TonB-dependent receptor [Dyadobacter chenwenxiniae]MCF0052489.1 TonB-dependent receptor [Dyadobacter chenwenxiniae]
MKQLRHLLIHYMKLSLVQVVLALTFMGASWANNLSAQELLNRRITLDLRDVKLKPALKELEKVANVRFSYTPQIGQSQQAITLKATNAMLGQVLEKLFTPMNIRYEVSGKHVILSRDTPDASPVKVEVQESPALNFIPLKGKVVDEKGVALAGVSILLQGTTRGTLTDADGEFTFETSETVGTLVFSFVGFVSKEVAIAGRTYFDVTLEQSANALNEQVVVGYGAQKRINMTGAVASITSEDIQQGQFLNTASLMQGKLPGLKVTQNSGAPGAEGINLQIRGVGTFSGAGVNPLVIIDGVAGGDINSVNPESIESISVLKDAASAAIYGARAANGVILVTTKTGTKTDKTTFDYHINTALHSPTKYPDLIWNSVEYMELWNEAIANFGTGGSPYTKEQIDAYRNPTNPDQFPNYNWLDKMFDTKVVTNQTLSFTGNRGATNFFGQAAYLDQPGTFKGYSMKRTSMQFNMDTRLSKILLFGTKLGLVLKNRTSPSGDSGGDGVDPLLSTMAQRPTFGAVLADGSGRYASRGYPNETIGNKNPWLVANEALNKIKSQDYRLQAYLKLTPIKSLDITGSVAAAGTMAESRYMATKISTYNFVTGAPSGSFGNNNYEQTQSKNNLTTANLYGNYTKDFGDHNLNATLGTSYETFKVSTLGGTRINYITSALTELDAGPAAGQSNRGNSSEWALLSYFGRLAYSFKNRYLLEVNARYDGSSRFSAANRWGFFPSFSGGWNVAEEDFFKSDWLNELKLRGSWGSLGNQEISYYPYQSLLAVTTGYPFDNTLSSGVRKTELNNSGISWEKTTVTDFGIDAEIFKRRLRLTIDYFDKRTSNILRRADIPLEIGYTAPLINDGVMINRGMELGVDFRNKIGREISYNVGGTISAYRNKLSRYGSVTYGQNFINREGDPFQTYYLWQVQGIFQSREEIDQAAKQANNPSPGDLRYIDQNGDGVINTSDKVTMDGRHPDFEYAANLGLKFRGFSLSAMFYGVQGAKYYTGQWGYEPFRQGSPPPVRWRDRWTPENPNTTVPKLYIDSNKASAEPSDFWLEDASYIRLRSLDISYDFMPNKLSVLGLSGLTIYLSGQNMFTLTKFTGFDPERSGDGGRGGVRYPQNKVYSLGLKVRF